MMHWTTSNTEGIDENNKNVDLKEFTVDYKTTYLRLICKLAMLQSVIKKLNMFSFQSFR